MDKPDTTIIAAIRRAARNLENSSSYQWGHMGLCNCGFLAQELTGLKKEDIHRRAMERSGDWSDQLNDYCSESGLLIDELIDRILAQGLNRTDLKHLERLSDPLVLRRLGEKVNRCDIIKRKMLSDICWPGLIFLKKKCLKASTSHR